jgi:F0F1-type ATP synthase membrane subunit b/b'
LARQEAGELVKRDAIVNAAQHRAENIIERARRDAEALRQDADVYIMDVFNRWRKI